MKIFCSILLFFMCLTVNAQVPTSADASSLHFLGIPMNLPLDAFVDSLHTRGFKDGATLLPELRNENVTYLSGRYQNVNSNIALHTTSTQQIDTLRVYLLNVNNPILSYKIHNHFYRTQYGEPIFDNFYDVKLVDREPKLQLAADPFITTFRLTGGIMQMELRYDARLHDYLYTLLFLPTANAQPVLSPEDDSVIEW